MTAAIADPRLGLSEPEAAARLARDGPNELGRDRRRGVLRIAREVLREPMFQLLIAAGLVYLAIGDRAEALILLGFALANVALVVVQESRTERVLDALRDLTSPRALVVRDGTRRRIAGREVVAGDILVLGEGDRVAADAILLSASDLLVDESLLTGESVPVGKRARRADEAGMARPGGDDTPLVFSGTMVVRGQALAAVLATGAAAEIGKIGRVLAAFAPEATPLQMQTRRLVRVVAAVGLGLSLALVVLHGLLRGGWLDGILAGITLAMSLLPQEIPLVLSIFLVLGAWRIARQRVLTRRASSIETLGAATVLCADKTGTLTVNRMAIARLVVDGAVWQAGSAELPEAFHGLAELGILASQRDPFDPMERAFHELGQRFLLRTEHLHGDWALAREYPLRPDLLALSHVWKAADRADYVVAAKGAPEAIADLCHLDAAASARLAAEVAAMAASGLRVLGVAKASFQGAAWPSLQHDFAFALVGLVGLADPLRPQVPDAIRACTAAGIRVVMITGDHPATARAIAAQAGLLTDGAVIAGDALDALDDAELRRLLARATVFARIMPQQKLRLVGAYRAMGEVVGMTGDGVNDAPALKAAHIGIAMGGRGTDVAREAASLVLLDDDFAAIVAAIGLGRRIYDNLRKAMGYILAVHVPIAGLSLLPVLFGWPLVFAPVHIVFLELVIDPVCSIVFEAEPAEADVMRRPPRRRDAPLFSAWMIAGSLLQGGTVLAVILASFLLALAAGVPEPAARALAFAGLVVADFGLILVNRSLTRTAVGSLAIANPALLWVAAATAASLALAIYLPGLGRLFSFAPPTLWQLALGCAAGLATVPLAEIVEGAVRRLDRTPRPVG